MIVSFNKTNDEKELKLIVELKYEKEIEKNNVKKMLLRRLCTCSSYDDDSLVFRRSIYKINNTNEIDEFYEKNINLVINTLCRIYTILKKLDKDVNFKIFFKF